MKTFREKLIFLAKYYLAIGLILITGCLLLILASRIHAYFTAPIPMSKEDIDYLCQALNAEAEPVCTSDEKIYTADFSDLISEMFESPNTTYMDFQHVFATYQTKVTLYEDPYVIVALYDLNHDGDWDLMPYFDGTFKDNLIRFVVFRESFD